MRAWLAWLVSLAALGYSLTAGAAERPFAVLDATMYVAKPDLRALGVEPLYIAYEPNLFFERDRSKRPHDALPDEPLLDVQIAAARRSGGGIIVIDIEAWSVYKSQRFPVEVAANIAKYQQTVSMTRHGAPDLRIGLFSPLPVHSGYDRLIAPADSALHAEMVADNDNLVGLAGVVDAIFPIGYTYTENRAEWAFAVVKQVSEARRIRPNTPVYVFLWPQYADYAPTPAQLRSQWLPADYWREQLETVYEHADGVVIWGGWNGGRRPWDDEAAWWLATREFMDEKHLTPDVEPAAER
jgi:hypothetical protein